MQVTLGRLLVASALLLGITGSESHAFAQSTSTKPSDAKKKDDAKKDEGTKKEASVDASTTEAAKPEDEGPKKRGLLFNLEFGFTRSNLAGFSDSLSFDKTAANGLVYGLGAGVRLDQLRLGARFRSYSTTEFTLWSVMAEVGYGIPLKPLEPIALFHIGYAWNQQLERATISGSLPPGNILTPEVDLHALLLGLEVNALYSINEAVKVGPFLGMDLMFLKRNQVAFPQSIFPGGTNQSFRDRPLFNEDGSSVGYNLSLGIRGVLDFGF